MGNTDLVHNIFLKSEKLNDLVCKENFLYQYRPLNINTYDQILKGYLWADSPDKFNDILDCSTYHTFIKRIYKKIGGKWVEKNPDDKADLINKIKNSLLISCLTSTNINTTMWSHYAEKNSGVCLKYDISKIKQKIYKVQYLDSLSSFKNFYTSAKEELEERFNEVFITLLALMKFSSWSYENEYRYISLERVRLDAPGQQWEGKKVNDVKLTGICFGPRTSPTQISLVRKLVENKGIEIERLNISYNSCELKTSPLHNNEE